MPLPRGDEYLVAVQNPKIAFNDKELKQCSPEVDLFGIPKPYSGGFTTTFHLSSSSQNWAVRCFTRVIQDLQIRYEYIGKFLQNTPDSFFVKAYYLQDGIKVGNLWYPIIKMQWINGETLNTFIERNISNINAIERIIPEFIFIIKRLEYLKVAHGDLQHGNIIVNNGKLHLIDYDGFYLPELQHLKTNEIGHINYQHPLRSAIHYNHTIDRFSSIVIYLGLKAVSIAPYLWNKYNNSENILFKRDDFVNVNTSQLINEISKIKELVDLVNTFKIICQIRLEDIPTLDEFISGSFKFRMDKIQITKTKIASTTTIPNQYKILNASNLGSLKEHIGERVIVVGKITDLHSAKTRFGRPYLFLNFGYYPNHTFTLVLWSTSINAFSKLNIIPNSFVNKWVKVTGVISLYKQKPQIVIESPYQIQVLPNDEEARQILGEKSVSLPKSTTNISHHSRQLDETIFNKLYSKNKTSNPSYSSHSVITKNRPQKRRKVKLKIFTRIILVLIFGIIGAVLLHTLGFLLGILIGYYVSKEI